MTEQQGLDQFTRKYLMVLGGLLAAALIWWVSGFDSRVGKLNDMLRADPVLTEYPYQFRVISLEEGVAEVTSPRSAEVPVVQFLRIVYPELKSTSVTDDSMMAAQDKLVSMQSRASKLINDQDDVDSIRWTLDQKWYSNHGVYLD
jgi:hypothetical protein